MSERKTIKIPLSLKARFLSDPENFIRDIAAISTESISPFFRRKDKLTELLEKSKDRYNPFDEDSLVFDEDFVCRDNFTRYMHIDLGLNKDAVGISMCHIPFFMDREDWITGPEGLERNIDRVPFVNFDFIGRIKADKGEEIILSEVRQVIYELTNLGFYIDLITYDGFQSVESIQTLRAQGYRAARLSVDRTSTKVLSVKLKEDKTGKSNYGIRRESTDGNIIAAWQSLKEVVYEDRIGMPYYEWVIEEARGLQEDRVKQKIDHRPKGTSDVIQSVSGSTFNAVVNEQEGPYHDVQVYAQKTGDNFYNQLNPSKPGNDLINEDWEDDFDPQDREYLY